SKRENKRESRQESRHEGTRGSRHDSRYESKRESRVESVDTFDSLHFTENKNDRILLYENYNNFRNSIISKKSKHNGSSKKYAKRKSSRKLSGGYIINSSKSFIYSDYTVKSDAEQADADIYRGPTSCYCDNDDKNEEEDFYGTMKKRSVNIKQRKKKKGMKSDSVKNVKDTTKKSWRRKSQAEDDKSIGYRHSQRNYFSNDNPNNSICSIGDFYSYGGESKARTDA
ncbi:hypothetical protein PMLGA01_020013200, partial [Plasmodium malariae]